MVTMHSEPAGLDFSRSLDLLHLHGTNHALPEATEAIRALTHNVPECADCVGIMCTLPSRSAKLQKSTTHVCTRLP